MVVMLLTHSFGFAFTMGFPCITPGRGSTSFLAHPSFTLNSQYFSDFLCFSLLFSVVEKIPLVPLTLISHCYRTFITANETVATPVRLVYPSTLYSLILNFQF